MVTKQYVDDRHEKFRVTHHKKNDFESKWYIQTTRNHTLFYQERVERFLNTIGHFYFVIMDDQDFFFIVFSLATALFTRWPSKVRRVLKRLERPDALFFWFICKDNIKILLPFICFPKEGVLRRRIQNKKNQSEARRTGSASLSDRNGGIVFVLHCRNFEKS